jgi:hypothetical protein
VVAVVAVQEPLVEMELLAVEQAALVSLALWQV